MKRMKTHLVQLVQPIHSRCFFSDRGAAPERMRSPKEENTRGAAESGWAASRAAKVSPPARSTNSLFPLLPRAAMPPPRGPLGSSRSHAASHAANRAISNRTLLAALSAVQRSNQRCTHAGARLLDGCTMRGPSTCRGFHCNRHSLVKTEGNIACATCESYCAAGSERIVKR